MRPRPVLLIVLVLCLAVVTACATSGLVASGQTLDAIGNQFVTTGNLYNQLHDAQRITDQQYRDWAIFAKQFQLSYPPLVSAWKTLAAQPGTGEPEVIAKLVQQLSDQLFAFYLIATQK